MTDSSKLKMKNIAFLKRVARLKSIFLMFVIICERIGITSAFPKMFNWILSKSGIKKNIYIYSNYKRFGKAFKNAFQPDKGNKNVVLFPIMFGNNSNFNLVVLLLAKHLETKGLHPVLLVCNSSFNICGRERIGKNRKDIPLFCYECYGGYDKLKKLTNADIRFMNEYISSENELKIIDEYEKIDSLKTITDCTNFKLSNGFEIGILTKKSILKFFYKSIFDESEEEIWIYKKLLKAGLKFYYVINNFLLRTPEIEKIILHNGTLAFNSYLFDMANSHGTEVVSYETYLGNNSFIYKVGDEVMKLNWKEEMKAYYIKNPLRSQDVINVDKFFDGLKQGKDMYAVLNKEHDDSKLAGINKYVCLFTNLNFDTAVLDRNTIFNSMEHWIFEVIDFWQENIKETKLIIRVHPAELKLITPSSDFIGNKIKERIKSSNVFLIDSHEKINSYKLIEGMMFGLIYSSTIGIEAAYNGKMCIIAGDPYYKNESFVTSPDSKDSYFEMVKKYSGMENIPIPEKESLYHFVNYIYFVRIKKFSGFHIQYRGHIGNQKIPDYNKLLIDNKTFLEEFYTECFG
ncbi:MAG: hypothetical protein KGZ97_10840 [Bacteroidetes bacterium]|nr:hypothetical protein [Bacteroidota bacterium]